MHLPRAAIMLGLAIAPLGVFSQMVTITERPSACSAIYTTGSSSVTTVQSTVTVAPIPFTDELVNAGTPFVIEVQPGTAARRRQATNSTYINANGRTTTNASEAVAYRILNGTLQSTTGGYISTDESSDSALFAISPVAKAISTTFFSQDLQIGWNKSAFDGGACEFYTTPVEGGASDIIAYFRGAVDANWSAITFVVTPTGDLVLDPTTSTTVSTVISMVDGITATPTMSVSTTEAPAPTSSDVFTENGYCGASAGICDGVIFGACCSQYGACGNTDEYCGMGCQSEFGSCDTIIASSSAIAGTSSAGPSPPEYSATAPQPATSSVAPIMSTSMCTSTSVFLSTSGGVTMTLTKMVPVTTSLPIYSEPGTIIGPINPPIFTSVAASSDMVSSSPGLPPSYAVTPSPSADSTFAGISSVPIDSIPSSAVVTVGVSSIPSTSDVTSAMVTSAGPGTIVPSYSVPDVASSSLVSISSMVSSVVIPTSIPLPSFYSSPAVSMSSVASSEIIPPIYSTPSSSSGAVIATPVASSCPGAADGTIITNGNGESYMIYCDSDYVGNLATPLPDTPSFDACLQACDGTEDCGAATYTAANTYCYLKPAGGFRFGSGGYVGVRVNGAAGGSSSSMVMVPTSSTLSVPVLPTEESVPPTFSTTFTPEEYPTTASIPEVFSSTPLPDPVFSSTPIPDTHPTPSTTDSTPSSTSVLVLTSPTRCAFGEDPAVEQDDFDCEITLPQPMVLYGKSSTSTWASTNGFISIIDGSGQYQNDGELPTTQVTEADNETALSSLFAFWDDLNKPAGIDDYGIYYQLSDTGVTYEYYLTRLGQRVVFHFTVEYTYSNPGVAVYTYYELDDFGDYATVGAQGIDATGTAVGALYSYQGGEITPGLVVICDTLANTCVKSPASV